MAKVAERETPEFVGDLLKTLSERIPGATADSERVEGLNHYFWRIAVVSDHFRDMDLDDRHDLAWGIAREAVDPHRLPRISMILCLTPEEFRGES